MENQQKIDVDELLRTKVPDHYHKIPRWLIRAVEWLVCQKDLNEILTALRGREGGDFAKGICSVFIGELVFNLMCGNVPDIEHVAQVGAGVAGLFALLGHLFPLYFGFKGGKGVLISAGIICALDWRSFLSLVVIFLIALAITKTVSKCSLTVAVCYPIITLLFNRMVYDSSAWLPMTLIAVCFAAVVIYMHRANIRRILDGTEPKTIARKKGAPEPPRDPDGKTATESTDENNVSNEAATEPEAEKSADGEGETSDNAEGGNL